MKKVVNVGIGGRSYVIDEDAYQKLDKYLEKFRERTKMGVQTGDVMEDLEQRIAELFSESLRNGQEVVNLALVNKIIDQLGMPDGEAADDDFSSKRETSSNYGHVVKKLYRDPDTKSLGGVCGGLALYLNVDLVLVRVLFIISLFMGGVGFWAYIIFWIVAPLAVTATQKCEMRGIPVTAENLRKYSIYK
jgi:phage shock protein PspC (stress-responsive transcriptional regulator)